MARPESIFRCVRTLKKRITATLSSAIFNQPIVFQTVSKIQPSGITTQQITVKIKKTYFNSLKVQTSH